MHDVNLENWQHSGRPTESLIYLVNYNALVAQKLGLIHYAVSRFLDEKERDLPAGSSEKYNIRSLRAESQKDECGVQRVQRWKNLFLEKVDTYKEELGRLLETQLPLDTETYLGEVAFQLEQSTALAVPFEFPLAFPEPGIFLQLNLSDVPTPYSEHAEKVHALCLGLSIPDEPVTDREYETASPRPWCPAFHRASLSKLNHGNRNDVASADLGSLPITSNWSGADIAGPSSSENRQNRVGSKPGALYLSYYTK
ncbi:hypothetical protein SeLEV6574_g02345 [Synchytrium endobioticum]|uniref:Uncharacterized protein n=1 Tax=Synchytrium endobioticum TaxID=286115 RepID=A0A507D969_9FUNG|nr:hypothetical protein SeLEV6574_g02345 [Synchytrium endobioticum]